LYAFAVDGALAYVGKTTVPLRDRLQRYKTPAKSAKRGGSTNIKNNRNILQSLSLGKAVEIYGLQNKSPQEHGGFVVNLAAGLEDSLIADLMPPWNGRQQSLPGSTLSAIRRSSIPAESAAVAVKATTRATAATFRDALRQLLAEAASRGMAHADIQAGRFHRWVGGYPGPSHSMPVCCDVMWAAKRVGDTVVAQPPKRRGASLTIRYRLPR
jgi:hypothetical protein